MNPAKSIPKGIQSIYTPQTVAAIEAYNADLAKIEAERQSIAQEQADILADAMAGRADGAKLRKRRDAIRDRTLTADLQEHAVLGRLQKLDALAREDFRAEAVKQRQHEADRRAVLEKAADALGSEQRQRTMMIVEDRTRRQHEEAAKAAAWAANETIITAADKERTADLEREVAAMLR